MIHNDTPQWMLTVPTAAQRTGDFSQTLTSGVNGAPTPVTIWDPSSATPVAGQTNVYGRNPYPNNIIPISQINPAALKIMAIYPLPNRAATDAFGNNNFTRKPTAPFTGRAITAGWTITMKSIRFMRAAGSPLAPSTHRVPMALTASGI